MPLEEFLKSEDGWYSTPIVTLRRAGSSIVLFGMMHFAAREYFDTIRRRLAAYESAGFSVFYEYIDPDLWEATPEEKEHLKEKRRALAAALQDYGMSYQGDSIPTEASWLSADISEKDWRDSGHRLRNGVQALSQWLDKMIQRPRESLLKLRNDLESADARVAAIRDNPDAAFIVDARDRVAAARLLEHMPKSCALFWGAAHLPGIAGLLEKEGFSIDPEIEWIRALSLAHI